MSMSQPYAVAEEKIKLKLLIATLVGLFASVSLSIFQEILKEK